MPISAERWKQIDELLDAALELPPAERPAFLNKTCGNDAELRRKVESLLRSEEEVGSFIESPAAAFAAEMLVEKDYSTQIGGSQPEQQIERYKILSPLGAGGMGEVWLAEDVLLKRKVALKTLPARFALDVDRVLRFRREGLAASALNHPNILTVYEIGQTETTFFIATEYVEGQTLRQRMKAGLIMPTEAIAIARQIVSALAVAHEAGIIHRDIKPENIMLRPDGLVKVLDFGLAKLTERRGDGETEGRRENDPLSPNHPFAPSPHLTRPGMVMGTASYMSPEQVRGLEVDARSDLFCSGVVLYEMLAGIRPFAGATAADAMAAILNKEPTPLTQSAPEAPAELEQIINRSLRKERAERYQTAQEMLRDLDSLKQHLEAERHLSSRQAQTNENRIWGAINHHRRIAVASVATVALLAMALIWFFSHKPVLTDKDTVLLADFTNTTGDAVFDGALKQALAVQLEQSPYLSLFPEQQARQTLRLMNRQPDEKLSPEVAREICQRNGIKALLGGTIAPLGSHFVLTLEAVNAATGDVIARQLAEANSKEQVLKTLGQAATELRSKLGESLSSIQKFDKPLEQVTTSSLDALKAYSQGLEQRLAGKELAGIPFFKRAVELDPNFARAYADLATAIFNQNSYELAAQVSEKAYSLRDRVSEREQFYIAQQHLYFVVGDLEKRHEVLEFWRRTYPRDFLAPSLLASSYSIIGQYDKALEETRASLELNPRNAIVLNNHALYLLSLNRYDEALKTLQQSAAQKMDGFAAHAALHALAFIRGDTTEMQKQGDWAKGQPAEPYMLAEQAGAAGAAGQMQQSREFTRRAIGMLEGKNNEVAGRWAFISALHEAAYGNCQQATKDAAKSISLVRNRWQLSAAAVALAMCGEVNRAQTIADEQAQRFPQDTVINTLFRPGVLAAIEINRNNPRRALELLEPTRRYELGSFGFLWPAYLRGLAYLQQRAGREAEAEFRKLIDHQGFVISNNVSPPYLLAQLGLARALTLAGDIEKARQTYEELFTTWKEADADLTVLRMARQEYERLKQ
ncbi:MAG: protein kinase [Acidobacteriota bacterium]|nr:protein kinase [Acidobacteriota bacterium]